MSFLQREGRHTLAFAGSAEEREAVQHLLLEFFEVEVDRRRDKQRDELRHDQPADDDQAQRPARRAIGSVAQRDRQRAQQRRQPWSS